MSPAHSPEEPRPETESEASEVDRPALPVFHSGHPMSAVEMDTEIYEHIRERAARRDHHTGAV
jgi:hypothetical protein